MPIKTLLHRRAGKIVENKLAIYSFVELQIQKRSKRHCKCRLAGGYLGLVGNISVTPIGMTYWYFIQFGF
jgi:hypothetical protein